MINVVDYLVERTGLKIFADTVATQSLDALGAVRIDAPPSIVQMIELNLERLTAEEQAVLETASVAGVEFPIAAVATALQRPIGEIEACCTRLSRRQQFVHLAGTVDWPDGTVAARVQFLHGLYREVLYNHVPPGRRVELHRRIAEREEIGWGERAAEIATELTHHYTQAGQIEQALRYARLAAEQAAGSRHAFKEAQQSYEQALVLLSLLPDSAERDLHELDLRQSIIRMLALTSGIASPQSVDAFTRAIALAKKSGNLSQLASLMQTAGVAAFAVGDFERAATLAYEALELAEREGNPTNLGLVYYLQVLVRYHRGDLAGAEEHFARGLKFFEDATIWPSPLAHLNSFGVASWNAWALGRADLARERLARVMAETNENNPAEVAWSEALGAISYLFLRENERAEMLAARALELSEKHQMPQFAGNIRCSLGWARAELSRPSEGVALIRQAIADLAAIGTHNDFYTVALAESQALSGAIDDALETIEQVLQPNRPDANIYRPEAFRLRGELQTKQERREPAEADFRTALTLARSMEAKALELRATMSLARLLRDTGRRNEACTMLAEIYNWFTEGFDTTDLKEAKALLEELAS